MLRVIFLFMIVAIISFNDSVAFADGCMMPREVGKSTKMVASPKQEALLATDGKTVQVVLRTHFRAGPEELAWIVPVPSKPLKIEKCSDEIFSVLEQETAPKFYRMAGKSGGGFSCGCAAPAVRDVTVSRPAVVVEQTGTAGIFKYVVLSATKADELTKWLNDNKYFVPIGAERIFDQYVKGGWYFLAMRIRPEASNRPTLAPHPISYTYRDDKLVYPLVISQLSADLRNEIVLYVVGNCRYACANWANATIDPEKIELKPGTPSGTNYDELVMTLAEKHDGRMFVTELAKGLSSLDESIFKIGDVLDKQSAGLTASRKTITRLRAIMTPRAMDRDVMLIPLGGWEKVDNVYHLTANDPPDVPVAAACGLVFAAFMGVRLTGRNCYFRRLRSRPKTPPNSSNSVAGSGATL